MPQIARSSGGESSSPKASIEQKSNNRQSSGNPLQFDFRVSGQQLEDVIIEESEKNSSEEPSIMKDTIVMDFDQPSSFIESEP